MRPHLPRRFKTEARSTRVNSIDLRPAYHYSAENIFQQGATKMKKMRRDLRHMEAFAGGRLSERLPPLQSSAASRATPDAGELPSVD